MECQKHLVMCRCILPQYRKLEDPPNHHFIVFSVINDSGEVIPSYAQCNNCGIVHKIIDICKSEIISGKEELKSLTTIDEISCSLSDQITSTLKRNNCDLPTWQMVQWVISNQKWGTYVVLSSDTDGDMKQGKYMVILGENLIKIESYSREEIIV